MSYQSKGIADEIAATICRNPGDYQAYNDMLDLVRLEKDVDKNHAYQISSKLKDLTIAALNRGYDVDVLMPLYKETLRVEAYDNLDSYLLYLESDREPSERFYQPRRRTLYPLVVALQELVDDKLDELFLTMPPRVGKLLADSTPVLTKDGWKNHGDLKVGDVLYSPDGKETKVIAVHPKYNTTHTVIMTDGSQFKCHFRHEWKVYDRRVGKWRTLETQKLIGHLENGGTEHKRGHRYNFQLPIPEPIEGKEKELPVSPYTLGAWLGDGTNKQPRINGDKNDSAIIKRIEDDGYVINHVYTHSKTGVISTNFSNLRRALNEVGMCKCHERVEKHIPSEYLTASISQRLQLLAGLIDTDGCLRRKEKRYEFTTSEHSLMRDFVSLVRTFGWRTSVKEVQPHESSSGIVGKSKYWVISFNPTMEIPCVLERKQLKEFSKPRRIAIKSIVESEPEQGNCITVERDGMYLAGETLTPTHNTTLLMLLITWIIGKYSEKSNLYVAYSDTITKAFYAGVMEVITDNYTYNWSKVFTNAVIASQNANDETLNINRRKRYPSLTCRSIYGTLNGACDCNGFLISDDLVGGIEEVLNPDRMVKLWGLVDNNMLTRKKEQTKVLWCGTRWSVIDPAGVRMELLESDQRLSNKRVKVINLPALNANDESNFVYDYGVGFSTAAFIERRASFEKNNDLASWNAQYMQQPIEREGTLFTPSDFRFYNGVLPDTTPDRIFMAVDPSFGGGDFVAASVCLQYGTDIYMPDCVYNNGDKRITVPLIVKAIEKWHIQSVQIEASKATEGYKTEIETLMKDKNLRANITMKPANTHESKLQRIFSRAADIRESMIFLEPDKRERHYEQFMQNVYSFKCFARRQHDDAPDCLAQTMDMVFMPSKKPQIFKRIF